MKDLHSDVFSKDNWGLLVAFLNADQLGLTEEEWKLAQFQRHNNIILITLVIAKHHFHLFYSYR